MQGLWNTVLQSSVKLEATSADGWQQKLQNKRGEQWAVEHKYLWIIPDPHFDRH